MIASHPTVPKKQSPVLSLPVDQRLPKGLELLQTYISRHGWERLRSTTRVDGFHLGHWVVMRRMDYRQGALPAWLVRELEALPGWSWSPREADHHRKLNLLRRYVKEHGWNHLTGNTVVDGVRLKSWVNSRRRAYLAGELPAWLRAELDAIPGWSCSLPNDSGLTGKERLALETLRRFIADRGWAEFGSSTEVEGVQIGRFVRKWRLAHRRGALDPRVAAQLEAIPHWSWESTYRREHHARAMALLRAYVAEHGWEKVRRETRFQACNLGIWCVSRREDYRKGRLDEGLRQALEAIPGWRWRMRDTGTMPAGAAGRQDGPPMDGAAELPVES